MGRPSRECALWPRGPADAPSASAPGGKVGLTAPVGLSQRDIGATPPRGRPGQGAPPYRFLSGRACEYRSWAACCIHSPAGFGEDAVGAA